MPTGVRRIMANTTFDLVSSHVAILSNIYPQWNFVRINKSLNTRQKNFYAYTNSMKNAFVMMSPSICVMDDIGKHLELIGPHGTGGNWNKLQYMAL
jgi:hypothetical protein